MQTRPVTIGNHVDIFPDGAAFASPTTATASRARATNVATITTGTAHGLVTGDVVTVADVGGAGYNATAKTVTKVSATVFTYASTGDDETTAADLTGTVTKTGTAGRESRPHDSDAGWVSLGKTSSLDVEKKTDSDEIFAPNPGRLELYDVLQNKAVLGYDFQSDEISPFAFELLFGTAALTGSSTDYTQLAGGVKKAWLRLKQYDQDNALFNTVYSFCYVTVSGKVTFGEKHVTVPFTAKQLVSTKNAGVLVA